MTINKQDNSGIEPREGRDDETIRRRVGDAHLVFYETCKMLGIFTEPTSLFREQSYMDRSGQGSNYSLENH